MARRSELPGLLIGLILVVFLAVPVVAQNAAPPSLQDQLRAQYNLSKVHEDGSVDPGTVLVVQLAGIKGEPLDAALAPAVYKDGVLHPPSRVSGLVPSLIQASDPDSGTSGKESRPFPVGDKVYVYKLDVNVKKDRILFHTVECGSCNGVDQTSAYKAAVSFQFAKGYLGTASVPDVEDTIAKVFAIDNSPQGGEAQQAPTQPEQPSAQPQAPPQPPPVIQVGQSIDDVVATQGQPEKIVDLGMKKIYVYKDLKITFTNGKVSDVQ